MILGACELVAGRYNLAFKHLIKAYELEPANPLFRYWYAKCLAYDMQYEEAYQLFELIEKDTNTSVLSNLGTFFKYLLRGACKSI